VNGSEQEMLISVVTPCMNARATIGACISSVRDQSGVRCEHLIQDGGSTDGTLDSLHSLQGTSVVSRSDTGMYDALNSGFARSQGDVLAHLNADEQYLSGALKRVADFFKAHPEVDVLFSDVLVVRPSGDLICYQKVVRPTRQQVMLSHLPTYTAGTFFRRRVWEKIGGFNAEKQALADSWWMLRVLECAYNTALLRHYTTAVTSSTGNLSLTSVAREESQELFRLSGPIPSLRWPVQFIWYRLKKLLSGCYRQGDMAYAVYVGDDVNKRRDFIISRPSPVWRQMRALKGLRYYQGDS
jgi:glycosyltransferase involved in cell wall biosynthesis